MPDLTAAQHVLRTTFGFDAFRPGQAEIVEAVLAGEDVLAVMPTGSGKSLCYQLPALMGDGLTLVVSPLISLMRNQVAQLSGYGIQAASLNSTNDPAENRDILDRIDAGALKLLYIAPERLAKPDTLNRLARAGISLLAVDEAHCISQWGHDFRPEYLTLGTIRQSLPELRIVALTATADKATRADIQEKLFPATPRVFVHGFDRPNLSLAMRAKSSARKQIAAFVKAHRGQSGIVYCNSRRQTEDLAEALTAAGTPTLHYHAGMDPELRNRHQERFLQEDGVVIAATVAFGMGIDKPDVRFVAHAGLPKNIESYYQEIGRAGRDGLPADTLALYGLDDIRLRRTQIEDSDASPEQKRVEKQRLNALVALCEAPRCRRQTLLAYFGETAEPCGNCDLCIDGVEVIDGTIAAQKALSAMVRTGERFGTEHLVNILCGEQTEAIAKFGHDRLPTFGVGQEHSRNEWRSIFRQLYAAGVISLDIAGYGRWEMTALGRDILKGQAGLELRKDRLRPAREKADRSASRVSAPVLDEADEPLFSALKSLRTEIARERGVPAYVIFPDRTLIDLAQRKPRSMGALDGVYGIGEAKREQYGRQFLDAIAEALGDGAAPEGSRAAS